MALAIDLLVQDPVVLKILSVVIPRGVGQVNHRPQLLSPACQKVDQVLWGKLQILFKSEFLPR